MDAAHLFWETSHSFTVQTPHSTIWNSKNLLLLHAIIYLQFSIMVATTPARNVSRYVLCSGASSCQFSNSLCRLFYPVKMEILNQHFNFMSSNCCGYNFRIIVSYAEYAFQVRSEMRIFSLNKSWVHDSFGWDTVIYTDLKECEVHSSGANKSTEESIDRCETEGESTEASFLVCFIIIR